MRRVTQLLRGVDRSVLPLSTFRTRPSPTIAAYSCCGQRVFLPATQIQTVRIYSRTSTKAEDKAEKSAKELSSQGLDGHDHNADKRTGQIDGNEEVEYDGQLEEKLGEAEEKQARTPWHREGADQAPVRRMRSAGAMTKGE